MNIHQIFNQSNVTNFVVDIPDAGLTSAFTLNAQSAPIPGIRIPQVETVTGPQGLGRGWRAGTTIEYDPLVIRFLVDENLDSWLSMYKWMLTTNNYLTGVNTAQLPGGSPEYITVHILDNSKTKVVLSVHFYKPFVSDLSEIEFNYTDEGDPAMVCTATIPFVYLQVEKDGKVIETRENIKEIQTKRIAQHPFLR